MNKKRNILIIGCLPKNKLENKIEFVKIFFQKKKWNYFLLSTYEYKHPDIKKNIILKQKSINSFLKFNFKHFDKILVLEIYLNFMNYVNVYNFLRNNGINETYVLNAYNNLIKRKTAKYNNLVEFLWKKVGRFISKYYFFD